MTRFLKLHFLILASIFQIDCFSQAASELSGGDLHSCIEYALSHNYDNRINNIQLEKGSLSARQEKSVFLPEVNAYALYNWYWGGLPTYIFPENEGKILSGGQSEGPYPVPLGLPQNLYAGLKFRQRLYDQRFFIGKEGTGVLSGLKDEQKESYINKVIYDVTKAYYEILELQTKKMLVNFNVQRLNRVSEIMKRRFEQQMATSVETGKMDLEVAKLNLEKTRLENGLELKIKSFHFLIGLPVDSIYNILPSAEDTLFLAGTDTMAVKGSSVQRRLLESLQDLNQVRQKQVKAGSFPSLDFYADLLWQAQRQRPEFFNNQPWYNISSLGLKLDIPVYHGSDKNYKVQQLKLDEDIINVRKEMLEQGEALKADSYLRSLKQLMNQYDQQSKVGAMAEKYFNQVFSKFEQGLSPVQDLLSAHADLVQARTDISSLHYQIKIAELEYLAAVGDLDIIYH
jgi:outer membrane protein